MSIIPPVAPGIIAANVASALAEDIGSGDLTAGLIPENAILSATVICREDAILCGQDWFKAVYRALSGEVQVNFLQADGSHIKANTVICRLSGPARAVLSGERAALNFIQTLSGTATRAHQYAQHLVPGTDTKILDTRKTLPGLRQAQKYAVRCGGCHNHRMGLYDAILIKENHIQAAAGISTAIAYAHQQHPGVAVEIEVENLAQLQEAIAAGADIVMLDNFADAEIVAAVAHTAGRVKLEVSGNITAARIALLSGMGIDYISSGALTKDVTSIDFSMRFTETA